MARPTELFVRLLAVSCLAGASSAQVQMQWSTFCGGASGVPQLVNASASDATGATFVAGCRDVDPGSAVSCAAMLTKVDRNGAVLWTRTYDHPTGVPMAFEFLEVDPAGYVVAAGTTLSGAQSIVARYDDAGNLLWSRVFTGPSGHPARIQALRVATTGDVVVAGWVSPTGDYPDACVVRFRPDGSTAWTYVYFGSTSTGSAASDVVLDAAGNAFVVGQATTTTEAVSGLFAVELGLDGTPVWSTELLPPLVGHHQSGQRAAVDAQGRLYVAGGLFENNQQFLSLLQFDALGAYVWDRKILTEDGAFSIGLAVRADGSVLVGAHLSSSAPDAAEAFVGAWDPTGTALWSASYDAPGSQQEFVTDLDFDPAGGAILTGWQAPNSGRPVAFAVHFTDDGVHDWTELLDSNPAYETFPKLHVAADGSLRIHSRWNLGSQDFRILLRRFEHDVTVFCSGDGGAAPCPCGNAGGPRAGCANSSGAGAMLDATGAASLSSDTLRLRYAGLPQTTVSFFQGTERVAGGSGTAFGDGLRCAGGTVVRLSTQSAVGTAEFPDASTTLSNAGGVTTAGLRTYQCWYRNGIDFCTPATFNTSNGLAILWRP